MSADCHCGERAENQGDAGKSLAGVLAAVEGGGGDGAIDIKEERQGESEQSAVLEATGAAASNWYTRQLQNTHTHSLTTFFLSLPLSL